MLERDMKIVLQTPNFKELRLLMTSSTEDQIKTLRQHDLTNASETLIAESYLITILAMKLKKGEI
jgi:hypothetical protein